MSRTKYATETWDTPQKGPRVPPQVPSYVVIHHAATLSLDAVVQLEMGGRQVSSTVVVKDTRVASMFEEEPYRAWSLSSQEWDSKSLSSETCNSGGAESGWPISEASYETLANIVAEWCTRYSIPCNRDRIIGHREVYTRHGASYATACPGGIDLDRVVQMAANKLTPTTVLESDMEIRVIDLPGNSPSSPKMTFMVFGPTGVEKEIGLVGWNTLSAGVQARAFHCTPAQYAAELAMVRATAPASSGEFDQAALNAAIATAVDAAVRGVIPKIKIAAGLNRITGAIRGNLSN